MTWASSSGSWMLRIASANPGPTPWAPRSSSKCSSLLRRSEPVQGDGALTDVGVHSEKRLVTKLQACCGPRRDDKPVADAGNVHDDLHRRLADRLPLGHHTSQRRDHRGATGDTCPRGAFETAGSRQDARAHEAVLRWHRARARASAASAGLGTVPRSNSFATIRCTWSLVAPPKPVTASLTSLEVYSTTSQPSSTAVKQRDPARLPDRHRGAGVGLEEDALDDDDVRVKLADELVQLATKAARRTGTDSSTAVVITPAAMACLCGPSDRTQP